MKKAIYQIISVWLCVSTLFSCLIFSASANTNDLDERVIVSLGDSFSSGEGIEPFYGQSEPLSQRVNNSDWLAHRSQKSWPGMLKLNGISGTMADNHNTNWFFGAVSGAITDNLYSPQKKEFMKVDFNWGYNGEKELAPQLEIFEQINDKNIAYVTLTLGGNDAGFADIITASVIGSTYLKFSSLADKLNSTWDEFYKVGGIRDKLYNAYEAISEKAGKNATIIVAGYPKLLDQSGKGLFFSFEEASMINNAVTNFNMEIENIVEQCRKKKIDIHFVSVEKAFDGHEAYSNNPYINSVILGTKPQDLKDISISSAYSIHPNYKGACAYARCVQAKIDELEGLSNVTCSPEIDVSVLDYGGNLCDSYEIIIDGKSNGAFGGLFKNDYHKEIQVNEAKVKTIRLTEGKYNITVTDGELEYTKTITVKKKAIQDALRFETDFNYEYYGKLNDDIIGDDIQVAVTSGERDIVLVLDNSGSMYGTPIRETKKASEKFIETILKEDASIGIVKYESSADMISNFSMDENQLKGALDKLYASGGTNILSGLTLANEMLQQSNAKKQIIVLMSDGLPSNSHDELIEYAEKLREKGIIIYTLGFFEEVGYDKSSAQSLMEGMASEGCHYEVADADSLVYFFGDVADQISGQKYIYIRIACPVDVTVKYRGETLCSEVNDLSTRTSFGSLTFEENTENSDGNSTKDDRVKILRLKEGIDYDIHIEGTGRGRMNYTIGFMDEDGEYSDVRRFYNIKITNRTVIDTVASNTKTTVLEVDEDGDGKYDLQYKAKENSRGEIVETSYIWFIIGGSLIAIIAIGISIVIIKKRKLISKKGL